MRLPTSEVRLIDHKNGLMARGEKPRNSTARHWARIQARLLRLTKFAIVITGNGIRIKERCHIDAQGNIVMTNFNFIKL